MEDEDYCQFAELFNFAQHPRDDVKEMAFKHLIDYSANEKMIIYATGQPLHDKDLLPARRKRVENVCSALTRSIGIGSSNSDGNSISHLAMTLLINFSGSELFNEALTGAKTSFLIMDNISNQKKGEAPKHMELSLKLLVNLVHSQAGKNDFIGLNDMELVGYHITKLLNITYDDRESLNSSEWTSLMSLFQSLSCEKTGRQYLISPPGLDLLMVYGLKRKEHSVLLHSLSALKHIIWETDLIEKVLNFNPVGQSKSTNSRPYLWDCLAALLLQPLGTQRTAVMDEDRTRNPMEATVSRVFSPVIYDIERLEYGENRDVREEAIQVFIGLLRTSNGRQSGRDHGLYDIIRLFDQTEEDEMIKKMVSDHIHLVVYDEKELEEQDEVLKRTTPGLEDPTIPAPVLKELETDVVPGEELD